MNWPALAAQLATLRKSRGLTQRALADLSGVGVKSIASFECGNRTETVKLAQIEAIVEACGMTLSEFFAGTEPARRDTPRVPDATLDAIARTLARRRGPVSRDYPTAQSSLAQEVAIRWR